MESNKAETTQALLHKPVPVYALIILAIYIITYSIGALWLFFDGWLNEFSVLKCIWNYPKDDDFPVIFQSAMHSICGAIMGCGVLGIVSFYKYVSVENNFQLQHLWGYFFSPLLAIITGLIAFALLQSGLLVFSGQNESTSDISNLGYLAIGFISGYGWYQFTIKIDELVGKLLSNKKRPKKEESPASIE